MQRRSEAQGRQACKSCPYAAFCVPRGSALFFQDAEKVTGYRDGDVISEVTMNRAVRRTTAFYLSLPRECPDHPAKENTADVIKAMQALSV
jgi:hypothetical protein